MMLRSVSLILLFISTLAVAQVRVTTKVTRSDRFTSSLISFDCVVEVPVGTTVEFPEVTDQHGITFVSRTVLPVVPGDGNQLIAKSTYAFTIPMAGTYELDLPDLLLNNGEDITSKSVPVCKLQVLSRLPANGPVILPFLGKIANSPRYGSKVIWGLVIVLLAILIFFLLRRRSKQNQPSTLEKLRLLHQDGQLTPVLLRSYLLASVGLAGSVYSNSELNAMISDEKRSSFDSESLFVLLNELNESAFTRTGILSDALVARSFEFIEQNEMRGD